MIEKTRKIPPFVFISAGLFVSIGLTALIFGSREPASPDAAMHSPDEVSEQPIPLIDQQAPRQFKTATFALG